MPPPETFERHDYAVYWRATGIDRFGEFTFDDPIEIKVRWELGRKEMQSPSHTPISVDGTVVTTIYMPIGSLLWRGRLDDVPSGTGSGLPFEDLEDELMSVNGPWQEAEDVKGRFTRRETGLKFYKNTLP
jgi:hypothetical protein